MKGMRDMKGKVSMIFSMRVRLVEGAAPVGDGAGRNSLLTVGSSRGSAPNGSFDKLRMTARREKIQMRDPSS